jgi:hypothetical protein
MKYIITESQYGKLIEQRKNLVQTFMETKFPEMGRLRKRQTRNMTLGHGYKFFNPKTNDVLFHVVSGGPVYHVKGGETKPLYEGIRLYVNSSLYESLENYIGNFKEELLQWFNETYKQQTNRVMRGIR